MGQTAKQFETTITQDFSLDYLLSLPKDYDESQEWPLLLFLHGMGERGDDLDLIKKHGPSKQIERGDDLPFLVVSPQCPLDHWWTDYVDALIALLDDLKQTYSVDGKRVYLTGTQHGGIWRMVPGLEIPGIFCGGCADLWRDGLVCGC